MEEEKTKFWWKIIKAVILAISSALSAVGTAEGAKALELFNN